MQKTVPLNFVRPAEKNPAECKNFIFASVCMQKFYFCKESAKIFFLIFALRIYEDFLLIIISQFKFFYNFRKFGSHFRKLL